MRVVRIYHAGRDAAHRERDRALVRAGIDVALVVPTSWPGPDQLTDEPFRIIETQVTRPGDVNRHTIADIEDLAGRLRSFRGDVLDLHEEPFSSVVHQILRRRPMVPVVTYAAQNIDKRFPPPFAHWERRALGRIDGIYPCSNQAASVVVGKGFGGEVEVLPLAPPPCVVPGAQAPPDGRLRMLLVGRFEPEKGILDAVRVLAELRRQADVTLELVGAGPEEGAARALADTLGVAPALTITAWLDAEALARRYAEADVLLAPSRTTATWVEQFGRMVVEAQAAGAVVVGYASGSLPEVVGAAGLLVPEGREDLLADAVRGLLAAPQKWTRLRELGLAAAETRTWDAVAARQIALYERVLAAPRSLRRSAPQRDAAVERFGNPARVAGTERPFALPVLRNHPTLVRPIGAALDLLAPRSRPAVEAPERIRVVFLDHIARMSGGELAMLRLIAAMPDVDAHVILGEPGPLHEALAEAGASVEIMELDPSTRDLHRDELGGAQSLARTAAYVGRLARRLRELKPDLVHTNSMKSGYYGSLAARLARIPVIWHLRDRVADDYLPVPVVKLTHALLATLPDLVVSNSAETARTAGRRVRAGAIVNSPVIHDPYGGGRDRVSTDRAQVAGIVGRLADWKGQDVFVRALARLRESYPDITGRIVGSAMFGEDAYADELEALVAELGLSDIVTFTGFVTDVERELGELDVLVHASRVPEPFGQVVVEGMAAGLPVVATDAGGPAEIITDGEDGLLVPPGDAEALAAAVARLFDDASLRARLGQNATRRAADFAPEVIGPRMQSVYRQLLASAR